MSFAGKYLNPKNDAAFKRIFGTEKNKDILITMLNAVLKTQLHKPIVQIEFLSPILEPDIAGSKESIVDVFCKDKDGCKYIIEMQISHTEGFEARAQYYASKAFISQAKKGDLYEDLKEVIFIAFCDFNIFAKKKHYKSIHTILDNKTNERNLDKLSFTFIDLVKFAQQCSKNIKDLTLEEKFYYFLCHADDIQEEDLTMLIANKTIKKAFVELERFSWSESEYAYYESVKKKTWDYISSLAYAKGVGNKTGEKKGIKIGKKEGIKIGKKEGIKIGKAEGIKIGKEEGIKVGKKEGRKEGKEEGRKEANAKAVKVLLELGMSKAEMADRLKIPLIEIEDILTKQ